jgi:hypothetical protein
MGEVENVGLQCFEPHIALINESGVRLIYIDGSRHFGPNEIFEYQDEYVRQFTLFASRLNENEVPTEIWSVAFRENFIVPMTKDDGFFHQDEQTGKVELVVTRKAPKWDGIVTPDLIAVIKTNIQSALLSHPTWHSDYGRPDIPARSVEFVPEVRKQ